MCSVRDPERNVTMPLLARWSLTPAGHAQLKRSAQYPVKPMRPRQKRLSMHDARTTESIVHLIQIARPHGLSGIYVTHELRLDPRRARPVCDALVVMQLGEYQALDLVPWSNDPALEEEQRYRFAIEADNGTEPPGVLRGKGLTYARLHSDDAWRRVWSQQYGPLPLPVWVAPTMARAHVIQQQWRLAWPQGTWLVADDDGLARNQWLLWQNGQERVAEIHFARVLSTLAPRPETAQPSTPPTPNNHADILLMAQQQRVIAEAEHTLAATIAPAQSTTLAVQPPPKAAVPPPAPAPTLLPTAQRLPASNEALQMSRSTQPDFAALAEQAPTAADYALVSRRHWTRRHLLYRLGHMLWQVCLGLFRLLRCCITAPMRLWNIAEEIWGAETRFAVVRLTVMAVLAVGAWFAFGSWFDHLVTDAPAIERGTEAPVEPMHHRSRGRRRTCSLPTGAYLAAAVRGSLETESICGPRLD